MIRIGRLQILILIWDCSWTNILSKKNWFPLLDAGAKSRKFSPNARGPGDRNPSLFHPETSEKCSNCHTEGFFFAIDRWKKEKSWRLHKISPFDVILKEKEQLLHFNWMLVQFAESRTRNNIVFQKLLDYESISWQSICFLCEATKILTDNETETFLDQMILFWDPDFFKAIFVHAKINTFYSRANFQMSIPRLFCLFLNQHMKWSIW